MTFAASPEPKDEEAVWHVARSLESGADKLTLNSGSSLKGRYEALSLNRTGIHHQIEATLIIKDLVEEDSEIVYYLRVQNELGSADYHVQTVLGDAALELTTVPSLPPVQVL